MKYLLLLLFPLSIFAQETVTLPAFKVSAATDEIEINNSLNAIGDGADFLNTPRSVSSIDAAQFNITSITEIPNYISDAQSFGSYGQSSNINIRGDMSEQYVNNQRRTANSFGFNQSFNAIESVDVIHGAPSVVFGPGFYSGGYTDFQTKQASFANFTHLQFTLGTWEPAGNSFLDSTFTFDQNVQINGSTAIRFSYEAQKDQTFYYRNGGRDDAQDFYITLKKLINSNVILDINAEFSWQAAPELIGINRVTQNLIWHDQYLTGIGNPYNFAAIPSGPIVTLNPVDTLLSKGDYSNADVIFLQSILSDKINPILTLKNYTMLELIDRRRFNQYEYAEYANEATFDNRTEWHFDLPKELYTIFGLEERYAANKTESDYNNTFFNAFDISNNTVSSALLDFPSYYSQGIIGEGGHNFFDITRGDADTSESKVYQVSPFLQQRIYFTNNLQFLIGLRADSYRVFVDDPLNNSISNDATTTSISNTESLLYSRDNWSIYATIGRLSAVNASQTGSSIVLGPNNLINTADFHSLNKLYEIGGRYQLDNLSFSLTGFEQWRQQNNFYTNSPDFIHSRGVELETKYNGKNYFILFNATYLEDNFVNSLPFEFNGIGLPAAVVAGNYRVPGVSRLSGNGTVGVNLTRHIALSTNLRLQSPQSGDSLGNYHLPSEYDLSAILSYSRKNWSVKLIGDNLTNQDNFIHNGDEYGDNTVLSRSLPINFSLIFDYKY